MGKSAHIFIGFIALLMFGLTSSCDSNSEKVVSGKALGTTYNIKFYSEKDIAIEPALDSIFERVNQSMSTYRDTSDISRLNRGDSLVVVDSLFQEVFQLSQEVYEQSEGYFDPTVGNLVNLYGFGPEKGLQKIDSSRIDSLMKFVGLDKIQVSKRGKITKIFPEVYLDFNAIAKGYAIDLIGHYLTHKGVDHFLVELGGELLGKGENLGKNGPWTVGIDDPQQNQEERTLTAAVQLKDRAMATSGNYRKNRIDPETGKMYVHTINPLTGFAEKGDLLSVSVLAKNCALADGYATAFMAMGYEKSRNLLQELEEVDAFLIYAKEDGGMGEFATPGFEEVLVEL